jgi:RNA polymerase sigma-70 factor, ECF subfamily
MRWPGRPADTGPVIGAAFGVRLAEAQGGDEDAFACLFRDVQPALLRYLRLTAPGAADDVASETWLQVVSGLAGFAGGESAFRAWLFTIARHRAIDWGRSQARRRTVPLGDTDYSERLTVPDAADAALERISTQAMLARLSVLPPDQAEIILLRVVAGLDATDVAHMVGKSPGAVRVAAHRGLRTLAARADKAGVTR